MKKYFTLFSFILILCFLPLSVQAKSGRCPHCKKKTNWKYIEKKNPTCTKLGFESHYQCKSCKKKATFAKPINPLGHKCKWKIITNATCEKDGKKEYKCTRKNCGHVDQTKTIPALGHKWKTISKKIVIKGVTVKKGKKRCQRCNKEVFVK